MGGEGNGHLTNDGPSARGGTLSPQPHDKSSSTTVPPRFGVPTEPPLADTEPPDSWKQPVRDPRPTNPSLSHLLPPQTRCRSNSFSSSSSSLLFVLPSGLWHSPLRNPFCRSPDRASPSRKLSFEPCVVRFGPVFASRRARVVGVVSCCA
ncbi:unnamed protein product, partial [Musa acuminata subsp. burmannicoides]